MNGFLTVARRELWERRNLVLAAPILALVPLLAPYVPGLTRVPEVEVRLAFTTAVFGFGLPLALAIGLGASALGDEVAGRRLGFFFSRPLHAFEIWGGKIVVALVVPVAVSVLSLGPLLLLRREGSELPWRGFSMTPWLAMLGFSWILASLAHVAAGLYRTRSPLLVLDLALAGAMGGAFYLLGWHLVDAGVGLQHTDFGPDSPAFWIVTLLLVGICLAAGFAQVAAGGSDPRLGHRALSLTLWGGLGLGLAVTTALSTWILNPSPQDLGDRTVVSLPGGHSFLLGGEGSRRPFAPANFLIELQGGRAQRVTRGASFPVPSPSGRHVLFGEGALEPRLVVVSALLGQPPVITRALLAKEDEAWPVCLSDDGLRAVIREGSETRVVDTATGQRIGLPALEAANACTFEGRRGLVLYRADPARRSVYRRFVDLETGAQGERVEYPGVEGILATRGNRVLVRRREAGQTEIGLLDGATGQFLARLGVTLTFAEGDPASFLPDGRVAFLGSAEPRNTLRLFDADGHERLTARVAESGKAALAGITPEGEICVVVRSDEALHTLVLDPQTAVEKQRIEGLRPAAGPMPFWGLDPSVRLLQSQERLRQGLFLDAQGAIVRLDRATGKTQILVAAGPGPEARP